MSEERTLFHLNEEETAFIDPKEMSFIGIIIHSLKFTCRLPYFLIVTVKVYLIYFIKYMCTRFLMGDDLVGRGRRTDALVDIYRAHPRESYKFIKNTMLTGVFSYIFIHLPAILYVGLWRLEELWACSVKSVSYWVIFAGFLLIAQLPIKAHFYYQLTQIQDPLNNLIEIESLLLRLTNSPAWKVCKICTIVSYVWFVLGVFWGTLFLFGNENNLPQLRYVVETFSTVFYGGDFQFKPDPIVSSGPCFVVYQLMGLSIAVIIIRIGFTFIIFYNSFGGNGDHRLNNGFISRRRHQGASETEVNSIGRIKYGDYLQNRVNEDSSDSQLEFQTQCAVCLAPFDINEDLRCLNCTHLFHVECVDKWLVQNRNCPLCLQDFSGKKNV